YSYLFYAPTFISLDPNAQPQNVTIKGLRIGINGSLPTVGQSFATLNTVVAPPAYAAASGQLLSSVGAVIGVDVGVKNDMFFLSFDQLGKNTHVFVDPVVPPNPVTTDNTPQPDVGVRTFAEINASLSHVTGVPITDSKVAALYASEQQSLPSVPQINAFTSSEQTAISQLAGAYCSELVNIQSYRDKFFGTGLDVAIANSSSSATFFGTAGNNANRDIVITPLVNAVVGTNTEPAYAAVQNELNALLNRVPSLSSGAKVSVASQAACQAVLGSAALSLK
ncbi:MAG TPA: hypothetical protein VL176_10375, partial [Steroidobacteraceae bacterium]|nr:hypothetical protein [Steroidobacteraceae bacterium]